MKRTAAATIACEAHMRRYQPNTAPYPKGGERVVAAGLSKTVAKNKPTPREQLKKAQARANREKLVAKMELALKADDVYPWRREMPFYHGRKWRFDIAWDSIGYKTEHGAGVRAIRVAIEIHGGIYTNGRHTRGQGFERDREKMNEAQLLGWTVIEVTEAHIDSGQAVAWVKRALEVMS